MGMKFPDNRPLSDWWEDRAQSEPPPKPAVMPRPVDPTPAVPTPDPDKIVISPLALTAILALIAAIIVFAS